MTTNRPILPAKARVLPAKAYAATALAVGIGLSISGCTLLPDKAGHADGPYPQTIDSPFGTTTIEDQPKTVAVTSSTDLDIALALGADPVIAPADTATAADDSETGSDSNSQLSPWASQKIEDEGLDAPQTYDGAKGPDLEAIKSANPDIILATGLSDAEKHFDDLSDIAPVAASDETASWTDRTAAVATALNRADEAKSAVSKVTDRAEDVASHHLEFEDTTYALADVRKDSIDYLSFEGSDTSFFDSLGLFPDSAAQEYSAKKHSVTKDEVVDLDADILLIHFPDSGQGLLDESELADPFYREVPVIRGKHYSVLDDDAYTALTNLSPLSCDWLLENIPDELGKAEQGTP